MKSSTLEVISAHFQRLGELMDEYDYLPALIWNADETSGRPNGKEDKILAAKSEVC